MYTLFPLLICAIACGMLGVWVARDAALRRLPGLLLPGWLLVAVLPVTLLAFVVTGWPGLDLETRSRWMGLALIPVVALVALAALAGAVVVLLARRRSGDGIVGRGLLIAAAAIILITLLLSVALALTGGSLGGARHGDGTGSALAVGRTIGPLTDAPSQMCCYD